MAFEGHEMTFTFKIKTVDRFSKRDRYFKQFDRLHDTLYMKKPEIYNKFLLSRPPVFINGFEGHEMTFTLKKCRHSFFLKE